MGRPRRALPLVLTVVATLLSFLAIFALWANRQLLNTDNWTESSSELLEHPAIREQISFFLVEELYANVDVEGRLEDVLPRRANPLAGPVAGGLRDLARRGVYDLLGRPRPLELWEQANRRAHETFLGIVEGDGGDVASTGGGVVTLDLRALLGETQERVGTGGRLRERLPADAGRLVLLRSEDLELAQDLVDFLKAIAFVLVALALALYALAVYLARGGRREALRACGFGLSAAGAAALAARSLGGDAVVEELVSAESAKPAAEATWSISTSLLEEAAAATLAYGVLLVLAAWLAGPSAWAVRVRRALAPFLREARYAYGAVAVIALLVLIWGPTAATRGVVGALLLVALLAAGVAALRRLTAREFPAASVEQPSP